MAGAATVEFTAGAVDAEPAPSFVPQALQKRLPGGLIWPHCAHPSCCGAPHSLQKRAPAGFSWLHLGQFIAAGEHFRSYDVEAIIASYGPGVRGRFANIARATQTCDPHRIGAGLQAIAMQPSQHALFVAFTGLLLAGPGIAHAQQFPSKPIRLVLPAVAGSQADLVARMISQRLAERWGFPVVIDNRSGAGGTIAASIVAKAAADGHTLLYAIPSFAISAVLQPALPYDPLKDFAAATHVGYSTNILVASPALAVKSVTELIAHARAQPGKLVFASGATGSAGHLSGLRFCLAAGIKVIQVAFKGTPEATIEVLAGRAQLHLGTLGVTMPFIKEGKLTALAVTAPQRAVILPEVPALAETLPEFKRPETSQGLLAPAGVARPILQKIGAEVGRILELPEVKERLQSIGYLPAPSTPDEYGALLRTQIQTLAKVTKEVGLRAR
jgi:tripartite-type tricarboxylate transporter receptor subunit TctC